MISTTTYAFLGLAIIAEVTATTALRDSDGFTRLWPSLVVCIGYAISFYFMSLTLREMSTGIVYAIWSGVGIVLISAIAWVRFGQTLDLPALIGLGLIVAGVLVVNLFSDSISH
ncbi:MAG: SMR family transporter [Paracraurococcus sp.]